MKIQRTIRNHLFAIAAVFLAAACGGGGGDGSDNSPPPSGNSPPPAPTTGTVGLFIKDAPTEEFDEILATVTSIELLGGGGATLFTGEETIDLLQLENFSELFAVATDVPAADYNKIRLILSDLTLIRKDENDEIVESASVKLPGNGKVDLNPRGTISVPAGGTLLIELDIDAKKSIKVTGTGSGKYQFRPVVFVNIMEIDAPETLARVHGEVGEVDSEAQSFELCQSDLVSDPDNGDSEGDNGDTGADGMDNCILVATDANTGIFDENGDPTDFGSIVMGDFLTAIGFFRVDMGEATEGDVAGGMVLDAVTIELGELGTFASLKGTISQGLDATTGEFGLDIAPGQDFGEDTSVTALLQQGTRIFDNTGTPLDESALVAGAMGQFDGVLSLTDGVPESLKASLIVLDMEPDVSEVLSGEILTLNEGADGFMMTTAEGDRCVIVDSNTEIFLVTVSEEDGLTSEPGMFSDLMEGSSVEVFGEEDPMGCFTASTINVEVMVEEPPPAADGVALYVENCEACHGLLAESERIGASASEIQDAIDSNAGGMMGTPELMALTPDEIAAIAEALQE